MGARGADDDGDLADPEPSDAVPEHDAARTEARASLSLDRREPPKGGRAVGLVVEGEDSARSTPVGAHAPGEDDNAAEPRALERPHRAGDGERSTGKADRHG